MRRFAVVLAVAGLVGGAAAACGDDDEPAGPSQGTVREIHLTASTFTPGTITIPAGTRVRWINDGAVMHTITPENSNQPGVWTRREISAAGATFDHTFTVAGQTYRYRCEPHSSDFTNGMVGTIIVQ